MLKKNLKSATSALIGACLLVTLAGCANGPDAPTRMVKQVTDGVEATSGSVKAVNVLLVAQPDGSAVLVGTFVNEGAAPDGITAITVKGIAPTGFMPELLTQNKPVIFTGDSANASAVFPAAGAVAGDRLPLEITFQNAGPMKLDAIVRAQDGYYASTTK